MQFSDAAIRALKAPDAGYTYVWDSSLRSFGVRVSAKSGSKAFCVLIGKGRRQTIGKYGPGGLTLAEARAEARRILAERTLGNVRPTHVAFEDARDDFLNECATRLRPITVRLYRRHLKTHYPFGRSSIGDITPREIVERLNRLNDTPAEKEHAFRTGRTFFTWCVGQHMIERSPMDTIKKPPVGEPRDRVLSEAELKAVYTYARHSKTAFHRLVCLLIHTGCRRGEISALRWAYIGSDTITLPAEIVKSKRSYTFPIGPVTQELIAAFPRYDSTYVFPASRSHVRGISTSTITGFSEGKRDFDHECGVTGWTLHDLRRTFSTELAALHVAPHVIERLINHASGTISGVAATYNRFHYLPEMRSALQKWEEKLTALLSTTEDLHG
ncbi:MAG: tyrosine-type recombinase/integrase [Alphaproteobacteria bacterium]|nr:tyrosine-type recombinase/integrase [Alphaproteobacteria bacterium]